MKWLDEWCLVGVIGLLSICWVGCANILPKGSSEERAVEQKTVVESTSEPTNEVTNESDKEKVVSEVVAESASEIFSEVRLDAGGDIPDRYEPVPEPTPEKSDVMKVAAMTFNIRYGIANDGDNAWPKRKSMVFSVILKKGGDFVGMQEAWKFQIEDILKAVPTYKCLGRGRQVNPDTDEWSPICYRHARWTPVPEEQGTFWLSKTPNKPGSKSWDSSLPRICTWARFVENTTGRAIYVFNTHFDHRGRTARLNGSKLIASRIAQRKIKNTPVLLMGDFNASESGDAIRYLKGVPIGSARSPISFVDTFRVIHPNAKNVGTYHRWRGSKTGRKIDYIFTFPGASGTKFHSAEIVYDNTNGRYPSDHFPVKATLSF